MGMRSSKFGIELARQALTGRAGQGNRLALADGSTDPRVYRCTTATFRSRPDLGMY